MRRAADWSRADLEAVASVVSAETGLTFPESRWEIAESAIRRAYRQSGDRSPAAYLERLHPRGETFDRLVAELTVGETYFFRDPAQFDFIAREVLPPSTARGGSIRAWSAGCATGEEPYSIAILLHRHGLLDRATVIGTDISEPRLEKAREGVYGKWSLRGCPPAMTDEYFVREQRRYRLAASIREKVEFFPLNLGAPRFLERRPELRELDLVLCRNVLIYLDAGTIARIARGLLDSLGPDGWLLLGASDPPIQEMVDCEVVVTDAGLAYRRRRTPSAHAAATGGLRSRSEPRATEVDASASGDPATRPEDRRVSSTLRSRRPAVARRRSRQDRPFPPAPPTERRVPAERPSQTRKPAPVAPAARRGWQQTADEAACVSELRGLLNQRRLDHAEAAFSAALRNHPESAEIAYLRAMLLLDLGRNVEAVRAARDALYLDRGLLVAHLALAQALGRIGDGDGAARALRNAHRALVALPTDAVVPGADGELAGSLRDMVRARMRLLEAVA